MGIGFNHGLPWCEIHDLGTLVITIPDGEIGFRGDQGPMYLTHHGKPWLETIKAGPLNKTMPIWYKTFVLTGNS